MKGIPEFCPIGTEEDTDVLGVSVSVCKTESKKMELSLPIMSRAEEPVGWCEDRRWSLVPRCGQEWIVAHKAHLSSMAV
jgi:hypothetical protein